MRNKKKWWKSVLLSSALFAGALWISPKTVSVEAAVQKIKTENNASKTVNINLEDYIVFGSSDSNYRYSFYVTAEEGVLYSFGNGKFWAGKPGSATVIISGKDKNGRDSFIADYKVNISNVKSKAKIIAGKPANETNRNGSENETPLPEKKVEEEKPTDPKPADPKPEESIPTPQLDMNLVSIETSELRAHRTIVRSKDRRSSSFKLSLVAPTTLSEMYNAKVKYENSNSAMKYAIKLDGTLNIEVTGVGSDVLIVYINEKPFVFNVAMSEEGLSQTTLVLAQGETAKLTLNGIEGVPVTWESTDPVVALAMEDGNVFAMNKGNVVITATAGEKKFACVVSVTSEVRKNVANYTKNYSSASIYSQPRRMSEGFYDCSSLVWRAFHRYGHDIILKTYAPVAAAMGKYYTEKGRLVEGGVSKENIENMVFEPGDLLFIMGNVNNGRYKNINHVEMIYGYTFEGFDADGEPMVDILYANNPQKKFRGFVGRPEVE